MISISYGTGCLISCIKRSFRYIRIKEQRPGLCEDVRSRTSVFTFFLYFYGVSYRPYSDFSSSDISAP